MSEQKFESWGIVEVMGHSRFAGYISEQALGGASFVRVDVPETDDSQAFTKLLGAGSIYAITPTTEDTARRAARSFRSLPPHFYEAPTPKLPSPTSVPYDDGDDYDEDDVPR